MYFCGMFNISQHLKTLLLEHNCVIIPELGGFVAQYVPAYFDTEAQKFFPPARKLAFNADLTMNDGLLIQSLMQTYDATFPEMQKAVEDKVADIKEELFTTGFYEMPGIGRLSPNLEGQTEFEPSQDDIVSPTLFGLELIDSKFADKTDSDTNLTHGLIRREGNGYIIRINRSVANVAAAAVCALFCYFSWTAPAAHEDGKPTEAKLFTSDLFASHSNAENSQQELSFKKAATAVKQQATKKSTTLTKVEAKTAEKIETKSVSAAASIEKSAYTIVLAQGLNEEFAGQMKARLAANGFSDARTVDGGKYFSVYYASFSSYNEAKEFLQTHKQEADFAQGWIYQIP